jgi:hypothetical protein
MSLDAIDLNNPAAVFDKIKESDREGSMFAAECAWSKRLGALIKEKKFAVREVDKYRRIAAALRNVLTSLVTEHGNGKKKVKKDANKTEEEILEEARAKEEKLKVKARRVLKRIKEGALDLEEDEGEE